MTRSILPHRVRTFVLPVVVAASLAAPCRAQPTKYLPDSTMLVVALNVKQLMQSPLVRGDEKAFKQFSADAAKALGKFGIDPTRDVDRIVLAVGDELKAATTLVLVEGRFDVASIQGKLRDLARDHKNDLHATEENGATIYEGRLPRANVPDPKVTLPERFAMTVLDGTTIALAADKAPLVETLAKKGGRKSALNPRVAELLDKADPRQTLSIVFVPPAAAVAGGDAAGLKTVTGGITVADGVKSDVRLDTADADAAKRIAGHVTEGLDRVRQLLPGLVAIQPGVGRKEQEMIKEMLDTIKVSAKPDAVVITSTITRELIEKNARKDQ